MTITTTSTDITIILSVFTLTTITLKVESAYILADNTSKGIDYQPNKSTAKITYSYILANYNYKIS